jgi:hypothetical protein
MFMTLSVNPRLFDDTQRLEHYLNDDWEVVHCHGGDILVYILERREPLMSVEPDKTDAGCRYVFP